VKAAVGTTLILIILCASSVLGDVVVMKDGRELEGKILKETKDSVTLGMKYGEIEVQRSRISEIRRGATALDEYEQKDRNVEETPEARYAFGQWCEEKDLREEAKMQYRKALEIDPTFDLAGKALRYEKIDGKWLSPDEAKMARGMVKFEGKWISKESRDGILAERDEKQQAKFREEYGVGPEFFISKRKNLALVSDLPEEARKELVEAAGALYDGIKERFGKMFKKHDWPLVIMAFSKRDGYKKRLEEDGLEKVTDSYGYYSGKNRRAYIFQGSRVAISKMLQHEFTHQVYVERMMEYGSESHAWIFEGLAEYFEGFEVKGGKLGKPRTHELNLAAVKMALRKNEMIALGEVIEVTDLSKLFDAQYESEKCFIAYGQAWGMVYYFLEADRGKHRSRFERFMKKDLKGEGSPEEFKRIFGSDLEKMEKALKKFFDNLD